VRFSSIGRGLALALLLPGLTGCLALGSLERRSDAINRGVAISQNDGLLLNLARASRMEPLYFTSTTGVHGSGSEDLNVSLPSLALGPGQSAVQKIYTIGATNLLDSNTMTSFDVGVLGSKDFYSGMLTPLGPTDVNLLFSQGYSRELVLYLVVDRLKVTDVTDLKPGQDPALAPTSIYFNDPRSPTFAIFKTFVDQAMLHGLTTEVVVPAAPKPAAPAAGGAAPPPPPAGAPAARLCYDLALATDAAKKDFTPESPLCGVVAPAQATPTSAQAGPAQIPVRIGDKKLEIVVYTRSIFGVFRYLGGLIQRDETAAVRLHHYAELASEETFDGQLLVVQSSRQDCFAQATYRGVDYCVPNQGADDTKDIFNILDALLALKTSPGDLPATPTVRITP
jgi:hypothetical protein